MEARLKIDVTRMHGMIDLMQGGTQVSRFSLFIVTRHAASLDAWAGWLVLEIFVRRHCSKAYYYRVDQYSVCLFIIESFHFNSRWWG